MDAIKVDRGEYQEQEPTPARRVKVDDPSAYGYDPAAIEFIDKYAAGEEKAEKATNDFAQKISELKQELKDLESQGMYFGDEKYDETYLKLEKVKQALKDYKQELTNPTPDPPGSRAALQKVPRTFHQRTAPPSCYCVLRIRRP